MEETRFGFGQNWNEYISKHFSDERVAQSKEQMLAFLGLDDLQGKTFLDIGCGSGIHSLAAYRAGAKLITSFDHDVNSVETTRQLHTYVGKPENWQVRQGSILDHKFIRGLPKADVVYSWGVLHHTGDVWTAFKNSVDLIAENGVFYVALYSANFYRKPPPEYWLKIKKKYVEGGCVRQRFMELAYIWRFELRRKLRRIPLLVRRVREYKKDRGMDWYTDVKDWLGGWPMEFCWDEDVSRKAEQLGLIQDNIKTGQGNTEFLFAKQPNRVDSTHPLRGSHRPASLHQKLDSPTSFKGS